MAVLQSTSITGGLVMHGMSVGFMRLNAQGAVVIDTNTYVTGGPYLPLSGGNMTGFIQLSANQLRFDNSGVRSWNIGVSGGSLAINSGDGAGNLLFNGRFLRDSSYRTIAGYSDYYSSGSSGWYRAAEITLTGNCTGAVLYGTLYDHRFDGADTYQIAIVARAECDFTSNNESHYINVGCTILGSTNFSNYRDKIRVVLSASSPNSRTYEVQFQETAWNHDTWQLETTGWTIYSSPQAPRSGVGTPRVNYISNKNADNIRANNGVFAPHFYDSSNSAFYLDGNVSGGWRLGTPNGILDFGPLNGGFCHFQTDRDRFYFNKRVEIDGELWRHGGSRFVEANGGTWGINISGIASNSSALNGLSVSQIFNNMGANHTARTSFDASTPSYDFGFRFIQGFANGPGTGGNQYYSWYIGLGNDYAATGAGSYGAMFAVDRDVVRPYLSVRYNENNGFGSWRRIAAGFADTAGSLSNMNISQFTNNSGYVTGGPYLALSGGTMSGALIAAANPGGDHGLRVGAVRGQAVGSQGGDYIMLYERVHIGHPNGWGAPLASAPSFGLGTWGSIHVSQSNATGGGIILADDGDIVDLNDAWCSMRFSSGVRIYSANRGGSPVISLGSNGVISVNGDVRAPIFYDSNNTGFYGDFASTSRMNIIRADKVRGDTNGDMGSSGWWAHDPYGHGWGQPHGSFRSLEVSTSGNFSTEPAMFRIHQWGSGAAEFWKPQGTTLFLRETPGGGGGWFTRFEVQGRLTVTGISESSTDMRAPIFYDSNDTGYYLDPNGTSNLQTWTADTAARLGRSRYWTNRWAIYGGINDHMTGTNGWGMDHGGWDQAWKGGFSGWDIWGTGTGHPQGGGYIHAQGIISGQHAAASDGSTAYGWMMVGAHNATENRYWLRGKWGTSTSGWVEMISSGNIGSQSVNYANTAGRAYPRRADGPDINFNWAGQGGQPTWLWGSNDGQNFFVWNPSNFSVNYANSAGSANSVAWGNVSGRPGDIMYYAGFTLNADTMPSNTTGFTYSVNAPFTGPIARFSAGGSYDLWIGGSYWGGNDFFIRSRNGDIAAMNPWRTLIHSGNIGSQSVSNANTVGGIGAGSFVRSDVNTVSIARHLEANTVWGNCGCLTLFLGWSSGKVILGNNAQGGHDYANNLSANTVVSVNPFFCFQDITAFSDARVKENVEVIENAVEKVKSIRGVTFTRNDTDDATKRHAGVIAQEVREVLPEVVSEDQRGHYSVAYGNLTSLLIEAIKEQQAQIEDLKNQITELKENK